MVFALIGNQNCGKTTLFNAMTGSNQHVGNFPGVTVEKKEGIIKGQRELKVVDLPGIYSLSPYTSEEVVTRNFLLEDRPDGIIHIVDATCLERSLYLVMQVIELEIPMVLALNMMDEIRASGSSVDTAKLEEALGIPILPIAASKGEGISQLVKQAEKTAREKCKPQPESFYSGIIKNTCKTIVGIIRSKAKQAELPLQFSTLRLLQGDLPLLAQLHLTEEEQRQIDEAAAQMEIEYSSDREAILADARYQYIQKICEWAVDKPKENKGQLRSVWVDRLLTHRIWAIPVFAAILLLIFWLTFGVIGAYLSDCMETGIEAITRRLNGLLLSLGTQNWLRSLVVDGIFTGVGSVLSFLPTILVLFFFLSVLEDSGYMARVAFVMDKLLRKIGLSGKSFVPLLIGFGCSVPAMMAARTLPSERDRKMTILLTPFMSCSAKLPVYAVFAMAFFPSCQALGMLSLYLFGMMMGILSALVMKKSLFRGEPVPFVMELPAYRFPSAKNVMLHMWEKAKDFIQKAFTIIFAASIAIWILQNFDFHFQFVTDSANSLLAGLGRFIAPLLRPLGFEDWRAATALLAGLTAKEAVISTFAVLGVGAAGGVSAALYSIFTPESAISFLIFTLLYMPCVAAFAVMKRELGSLKGAACAMACQTIFAWGCAWTVYHLLLYPAEMIAILAVLTAAVVTLLYLLQQLRMKSERKL